MIPAVIETMNDILNKVETREWKRVTQQSNVLLRKAKRQSKLMASMKDEIKRLKDEVKKYENKWKMFNVEDVLEIKFLTAEHGAEEIRNCMKENELLKLELKAVKDANVMFMKRYEKKVEEEKKITKICSRIRCEDTFGHLIGRIPS
jgi:ABC-type Fe3+-hydroxamate transport system substrate-binding protein